MRNFSVFDIIGPRMVGPSSSHTAGAAKLGLVANRLVNSDVDSAVITLYGSFAQTGRGHGTDKAITAGLLGMEPSDTRLRYSMLLAQEADKQITVEYSTLEQDHPNTAKIEVTTSTGKKYTILGASIGGGNIVIKEINGLEVQFSGDYPTLIVFHFDRPGIITHVTSILANESINVAFMKLFRSARSMDACMILETDSTVDIHTQMLIKQIDGVSEVCSI